MRRPNVKFIAWFFGSLATVALLTHLWHELQVRRNAGINLSRADELASEGRDSEAIGYLLRYLILAPGDNEVLEKLAGLQQRKGMLSQAYLTYENLARRLPERADLRRELARMALRLRRASDAQAHLEPLLQASPDDGELLALRAEALELTGTSNTEAREAYQKAIQVDPHQVDCYARLAELLRTALKEEAEADRVMMQLVSKNPGSAKAFRLRGEYYLQKSRLAEARADADRALALAADDPDCVSLAARCAALAKDNHRAQELANRAIELAPRVAASYVLLAEIEGRVNGRAEQRAALERGREALPQDGLLAWNLAHLAVDEGDSPAAERLLLELRGMNYAPMLLAYLDARVKLARGEWGPGAEQLEAVRPGLNDWPELAFEADRWMATASGRLGNPDLQLKALRSAARLQPASVDVAAELGELYLQMGRFDEALQTYRSAASSPDAPPAMQARIVELLILRNLSQRPESRDWRPIEAALAAAEAQSADQPVVKLLRAEVLVAQGKSHDGNALLAQAAKQAPQVLSYWLALIRMAERDRNYERAATLITAARAKHPEAPELLLVEAELAAYQQGAQAVEQLRGAEQQLQQAPPAQRAALLRTLASIYEGIGQPAEARRLIESLAAEAPSDLPLHLALFDLAKSAQDDAGMQSAIEQIEKIEGAGRGVLFRYAAAVRKVMQFKELGRPALAEARQLLREAMERRPGWARLARLAGEIAELEGDPTAAAEYYQQAVSLGDRGQGVLRRLVALLYDRRKFAEADQVLRRLEEQQVPFSKELSQMAAHVSLELNDFGRALEWAQSASGSNDYRDQIWLGAVLTATGRFEEADEAYRRATELSPASSAPWVALVQFLVARGRTDAAEQAVLQAREKIDGHERQLALANCYETLNHPPLAEQAYLAALEDSSELSVLRAAADFYVRQQRVEKAEELMRRIIARDDAAGPDLHWARRNLGLLWGVGRGYAEFERGLALLNKNLQLPDPRPEDMRAKAILLSAQPALKFKLEGIRLLEELIKREAVASSDLFVLAKLYDGAGRWSDAQRQLQALVTVSPTVEHVSYYVRALLAHGVLRDVDLWLARLKKLAPDAAETTELSVRLAVAQAEFSSALDQLQQFTAGGPAPGADPARLQLAARLCAELAAQRLRAAATGRGDEDLRRLESDQQRRSSGRQQLSQAAERYFRQYLELEPNDTLDYSAFLAQENRVAEAVKLLEAAAPRQPPARVVAAAQNIVNSGHASPSETSAIRSVLVSLSATDASAPLLTALGDLENFLERFDAAEQYYRQALKVDRDYVLALNNLAITLALRQRSVNEASLLISHAIEIAGPIAELLDSRATVALAAGDAARATKDLQEAIVTNPTAGGYFHLAQAQLAQGNLTGAKASYEQALKLKLSRNLLPALERPALEKLVAALQQ